MTYVNPDSLKLDLIRWIAQLEDKKILEELLHIKEVQQNKILAEPITPYLSSKHTYLYEDVLAIAAQFPKDKLWTYADLQKYFPQNLKVKVEILNHQLIIMPSPSFLYKKISGELSFLMIGFVKTHQLGKIVCAPMDTKFDESLVVQPDILFIAVTRYKIIEENCIQGAPDLLVEIISPSNSPKEQEEKHALYEQKGVREYWTIYPKQHYVKVETLKKGKFVVFSEAKDKGLIRSWVLEGFEVQVEAIIPENLEYKS